MSSAATPRTRPVARSKPRGVNVRAFIETVERGSKPKPDFFDPNASIKLDKRPEWIAELKKNRKASSVTELKKDSTRKTRSVTELKKDSARKPSGVTEPKKDSTRKTSGVTEPKKDSARKPGGVTELKRESIRKASSIAELKSELSSKASNYNKPPVVGKKPSLNQELKSKGHGLRKSPAVVIVSSCCREPSPLPPVSETAQQCDEEEPLSSDVNCPSEDSGLSTCDLKYSGRYLLYSCLF